MTNHSIKIASPSPNDAYKISSLMEIILASDSGEEAFKMSSI